MTKLNEVSLTLESFMLLCKLAIDTHAEKERLRKIVVMQNDALEKLVSRQQMEKAWIGGYNAFKKQKQASDADLDMRDKHAKAFWPPRGMIP